ncbi:MULTISPECIES: McrC family protein [unclassified Microbacterium]|uniref:McrC family protein n=1 Tax=unclassified Microbacterium TaxID=2609290 RepID=UPI00386FF10F
MTDERRYVAEKGETFLELSLAQATELTELGFCRVTPSSSPGRWRVTDVNKVGVAVLDGVTIHVMPKTPLENIVYMASLGGMQLAPGALVGHGVDRSLPSALAQAFVQTVDAATRRGLVKGYRTIQESASVVRGRWDIARQLRVRPGIPLPIEIDYDEFSEDTDENRILHSAIRLLGGLTDLPGAVRVSLARLRMMFAEVGTVPRGAALPNVTLTRLTQHYDPPLRLARVILDALSWTHVEGPSRGGSFLVNMANVFERYVAARVSEHLRDAGVALTAQDRAWWLDVDRVISLRPDLVIRRADHVVTVADTKYKNLSVNAGSPANSDVYQAVAYALALGVSTAHLIYVAGEVDSRHLEVAVAGVTVCVHSVPLAGNPEALESTMTALAEVLIESERARV